MRIIHCTQGKIAYVDDFNYRRLNCYKWKAVKAKTKTGDRWYAYREEGETLIGMHQDVLGVREGLMIDHRDGNGLNNREANLRYATASQNQANRIATGRYKGVTRIPERFMARIRVDGKVRSLGTFPTAEGAARAYDAAAIQLQGEFARLNFPRS